MNPLLDGVTFTGGGENSAWRMNDEDGDFLFELPGWLPPDNRDEIAVIVLKQSGDAHARGYASGRKHERAAITYGFKVVATPIISAINGLTEELSRK